MRSGGVSGREITPISPIYPISKDSPRRENPYSPLYETKSDDEGPHSEEGLGQTVDILA
jgi:hypothetical protein